MELVLWASAKSQRPRETTESNKEEEELQTRTRVRMQETVLAFSLFERALLGLAAHDLKREGCTKTAAAIQNATQCYCVIYGEKKSPAAQTSPNCFLQGGRWSWTQRGTGSHATHVRLEWNRSSPSVRCCWWSFRSSVSQPLSSRLLLACSLHAGPCMPAAVLDYAAAQEPILFSLLLLFLNVAFMWQLFTTLNYYGSTKLAVSWAPRLTWLDLGTNWTSERTLGMELVRMWRTS